MCEGLHFFLRGLALSWRGCIVPYLLWSENDYLYVLNVSMLYRLVLFVLYLVSVLYIGFRTVS